MVWFALVWISKQLFSRKSHNVAIVRKVEQSTSFPVDHHCKRFNNAKQRCLTRLNLLQVKWSHLTVSRKLFPASSSITRVQSRWTLSRNELTGIYLLWIAALWDVTVDYKKGLSLNSTSPFIGENLRDYVKHFNNFGNSFSITIFCNFSNFMYFLHCLYTLIKYEQTNT